MLFEVNNALNPELAAANALPKSDPVQTRGQSKAAAEFYTWKDTVGDLITQFAAGQAANLPALIAGNFPPNAPVALPAMALSYAQRWVNTYEPIYVAHGIAHGTPAAAAFAHVAPATLVPFPAIAPLPGGLNARVAAEQAALLAWFQGAHNPAPPPDQFYLAQLSTPNVYSYEQVREWNMAQMGNYLKGVQRAGAPAPLGNTAINQAAYTQYRPYWRDWADDRGLKPLRPYLFVQIMQGIDAAGAVLPQFMPTAPMIATATDDAARIIASKYADQLARRTIVGVKPLVAADANLQNAINALLAPNPPLNLPAWRQ